MNHRRNIFNLILRVTTHINKIDKTGYASMEYDDIPYFVAGGNVLVKTIERN